MTHSLSVLALLQRLVHHLEDGARLGLPLIVGCEQGCGTEDHDGAQGQLEGGHGETGPGPASEPFARNLLSPGVDRPGERPYGPPGAPGERRGTTRPITATEGRIKGPAELR